MSSGVQNIANSFLCFSRCWAPWHPASNWSLG
jgi:hypothetical protein